MATSLEGEMGVHTLLGFVLFSLNISLKNLYIFGVHMCTYLRICNGYVAFLPIKCALYLLIDKMLGMWISSFFAISCNITIVYMLIFSSDFGYFIQ